MCGIMLKHHGYNVTILEQEASQSRQGYDAGISFGPAVQEFLEKHDRVKRDMVITCPLGLKINRNGEAKLQEGQPMVNTSWGLLISVLRANFDGTTSKAVPEAPKLEDADGKATFRSGCRVTDVELVDGKMKVHLEDTNTGTAQTLSAGVVIAADGSNSRIRNILLPDIKREYSGYMCWRGTVPEEQIEERWNDLYAGKATFHFMPKTYLLKLVGCPDSLDQKALLTCD
jgi:2-polyprenyl-6-methoxyphenol hydroxylase-like FAD-dependent oxidoreductase